MPTYRITIADGNGRVRDLQPFQAPTREAAKRRHFETLRAMRPQLIYTREVDGKKNRVIAGPDSATANLETPLLLEDAA